MCWNGTAQGCCTHAVWTKLSNWDQSNMTKSIVRAIDLLSFKKEKKKPHVLLRVGAGERMGDVQTGGCIRWFCIWQANRHRIGLSWKRGACVWLIQWLLIVTGTYCRAALPLCVCVCVAACLMQLPEIESRANCEQRWAPTGPHCLQARVSQIFICCD